MPRVLDPKAKKLIEQAAAATRCDAVAAVEPFIEKLRELGVEKQAAERAVRRARQKTAKAATIKSTTPQSSVAAGRKSRSLDSSVGQVLEQVGLHRAGPQRYLTKEAMDIRVRSAGAFRIIPTWASASASEASPPRAAGDRPPARPPARTANRGKTLQTVALSMSMYIGVVLKGPGGKSCL